MVYAFYSDGPRGSIRKVVEFQQIKGMSKNFFNLLFGDWDESAGKVDDTARSNNNDGKKTLFTVAGIIQYFMELYPKAIIMAVGSTHARTRLYQINITAYWEEIRLRYQIYGKFKGEWLPFEKGVNYQEFLVFRKIE